MIRWLGELWCLVCCVVVASCVIKVCCDAVVDCMIVVVYFVGDFAVISGVVGFGFDVVTDCAVVVSCDVIVDGCALVVVG